MDCVIGLDLVMSERNLNICFASLVTDVEKDERISTKSNISIYTSKCCILHLLSMIDLPRLCSSMMRLMMMMTDEWRKTLSCH